MQVFRLNETKKNMKLNDPLLSNIVNFIEIGFEYLNHFRDNWLGAYSSL